MKKLIIAEKPSVAKDLARVIGNMSKNGDRYEDDEVIIDSALGHLVELYMPDDFDKKLKKWRLTNLPILPDEFKLKPIVNTKKKFNELKKLMHRADVGEVVNACDAGREGELIFTYVYELAKCEKPVQRLWMLSMTDQSIRDAYTNLRSADDMQALQDAARCRSESDWLIGINGTRAVTLKKSRGQSRQMTTVGRVQTPTLSLVVTREQAIRNFKPRKYHRITARFGLSEGEYEGLYQRPSFKKDEDNEHDRIDRIWDEEAAQALHGALASENEASVTETKRRAPQQSGRLFDLTTLQREANRQYRFSASRTLKLAQSLYERHKVITYPRTDSKALPQDYMGICIDTLQKLGGNLKPFAQKALDNDWVDDDNRRIFNDKQISDHFAIIPTNQYPTNLNDNERKIYDMIAKRFVAVFYPPAQWDVTTRTSMVGEHSFKTEGRVLIEPSWLSIYGKDKQGEDTLTALTEADEGRASVNEMNLVPEETKPPAHYTEATLLAAMENAGKFVEDEELAEAMKEKGLGTPATRAATIEHLINEKYLNREKGKLSSTHKGDELCEFLKTVGADILTSPGMTGEWEYKLRKIEEGQLSREQFMRDIMELTKSVVQRTVGFKETDADLRETGLTSPIDGSPLFEGLAYYQTKSGNFRIGKSFAGRRLETDEAAILIKDGRIGPLDGFISKAGRPFSAMLKLEEDNKVTFVFNETPGSTNADDPTTIVDAPVVGKCPICQGEVRETESSIVCVKNPIVSKGKCKFRVTKTLLDKEIPSEELRSLLNEGKTSLIKGFKSRKTRRLFDASLFLKEDGGIGFDFPSNNKRRSA